MEERLNQFGLEIAPEKTQCIEFGVFAIKRAKARGQKAATFDFLGFTHYCSRSRNSKCFRMKRKTISKRLTAKLKAYKGSLKSNRNLTTPEIIQKTVSKLRGHYDYYGVTDNSKGINAYFYEVRGYTLQMAESERQAGVLQLGEICQAVTALSIADTTNHQLFPVSDNLMIYKIKNSDLLCKIQVILFKNQLDNSKNSGNS